MKLTSTKLLITATGITGVSATSAVLSSGVEGGSEEITPLELSEPKIERKPFQKPNWAHKSIPTLSYARDIQHQYQNISCVKDYFKEIVNWNENNSSSNFNDIQKFSNNANTTSCLVAEYYKQNYQKNWWWGEFRLIWSVKDVGTKQGFLTVIEAKPRNRDFIGSSAAYILKTDDAKEKWTISHSKEKNDHIDDKADSFSKLVPEVGWAFYGTRLNRNHWGFEPGNGELCRENYCFEKVGEAEHESTTWKLSAEGTREGLVEWNRNLSSWLNNNFGWGWFADKIKDVYGIWEQFS